MTEKFPQNKHETRIDALETEKFSQEVLFFLDQELALMKKKTVLSFFKRFIERLECIQGKVLTLISLLEKTPAEKLEKVSGTIFDMKTKSMLLKLVMERAKLLKNTPLEGLVRHDLIYGKKLKRLSKEEIEKFSFGKVLISMTNALYFDYSTSGVKTKAYLRRIILDILHDLYIIASAIDSRQFDETKPSDTGPWPLVDIKVVGVTTGAKKQSAPKIESSFVEKLLPPKVKNLQVESFKGSPDTVEESFDILRQPEIHNMADLRDLQKTGPKIEKAEKSSQNRLEPRGLPASRTTPVKPRKHIESPETAEIKKEVSILRESLSNRPWFKKIDKLVRKLELPPPGERFIWRRIHAALTGLKNEKPSETTSAINRIKASILIEMDIISDSQANRAEDHFSALRKKLFELLKKGEFW